MRSREEDSVAEARVAEAEVWVEAWVEEAWVEEVWVVAVWVEEAWVVGVWVEEATMEGWEHPGEAHRRSRRQLDRSRRRYRPRVPQSRRDIYRDSECSTETNRLSRRYRL